MIIIGLTGNIASGKSTVSGILESLGAVIIDADRVAREVVEKGTPGLQRIVEGFGRDVLRPDGALDREKMARRVFADPAELARLNAITHPLIIENIRTRLEQLSQEGKTRAAVVDAALLIEVGLQTTVDELWVVVVDHDKRIKRVMERDGISREAAEARLASQMPQEEKARVADVVIDNNGTPEQLRSKVEELWRRRFEH